MFRQGNVRALAQDDQSDSRRGRTTFDTASAPDPLQAFYRPTAIVLLAAAAAHLPVIGQHLREAPYVGYSFIGFCVAAIMVAVALMVRGRRALLVATAGLCAAALSAYGATRLFAFPLIGDDVGNWAEPAGVASVVAEAVAVGLALCGLRLPTGFMTALRWPTAGLTGAFAGGIALMVGVAPSALAIGPMHMAPRLAATTATSCPGPLTSPPLTQFTQQLTVPPRIDLRSGQTATTLTMRAGSHKFHADLGATPVFGYTAPGQTTSDVYGGPTIEALKSRPVKVDVVNSLGQHPLAASMDQTLMGMTSTDSMAPRGVLHLHGAHSEPSQDGLPADSFKPGAHNVYSYVNDQEATGLWYHDHAWGMTRLQVTAGLAGQYWLRDAYDTGNAGNPLGLPTGGSELPLTLQDRTFNADGTFAYPVGAFCGGVDANGQPFPAGYPNQWSPESFGDVAVVNGKATPNLNVARGVYRFRVLNGSNARFYHLGMPAGAPVYQIGSDGGLLDAPVRLSSLLLAPAERADLLIDFRRTVPGQKFRVTNDAVAPYPSGGDGPLPNIMQFTTTAATGFQGAIPTRLRGGAGQPRVVPTLHATRTRTIMLNEIADPTLDEPVRGQINNQAYSDATGMKPRTTQIESPQLDTVEEWDIVNTTGDAHPIHIHLTQFQLLNRQNFDEPSYTAGVNTQLASPGLPDPSASGKGPWPALDASAYLLGTPTAPAANERGWKDTIVAPPGQITRIIVPFGGSAAGIAAPFVGDTKTATVQRFAGTYVFHCHILEHEDNDMMQPYEVKK
jgi:FtsP/CotA-like multicopper oxidase with cupredoxin domain